MGPQHEQTKDGISTIPEWVGPVGIRYWVALTN